MRLMRVDDLLNELVWTVVIDLFFFCLPTSNPSWTAFLIDVALPYFPRSLTLVYRSFLGHTYVLGDVCLGAEIYVTKTASL
jgi:hypothetical protein